MAWLDLLPSRNATKEKVTFIQLISKIFDAKAKKGRNGWLGASLTFRKLVCFPFAST